MERAWTARHKTYIILHHQKQVFMCVYKGIYKSSPLFHWKSILLHVGLYFILVCWGPVESGFEILPCSFGFGISARSPALADICPSCFCVCVLASHYTKRVRSTDPPAANLKDQSAARRLWTTPWLGHGWQRLRWRGTVTTLYICCHVTGGPKGRRRVRRPTRSVRVFAKIRVPEIDTRRCLRPDVTHAGTTNHHLS